MHFLAIGIIAYFFDKKTWKQNWIILAVTMLVDIDHSPDENLDAGNLSFYMAEGLRRVRAHLEEAGVLAVWSSAANESFVSSLEDVFSEVRTERVEWHNELIEEDQCDLVFLARR